MRAWVVLGALLLVPGAVAQASVPTSLFIHIIDVQDAPINTQVPPPDYVADVGWGLGGSTLRCLHPTTGDVTAGSTSQAFHTWRAYGHPQLVEYGMRSADGMPRMHPSRGVGGNVSVDATAPMALHWFLKATNNVQTSGIGLSDVPSPALAVPNVLVRATIRSGDDISVDDIGYDSGRLLFHGEAGPATLANGEVLVSDDSGGTVRPAGQVGGDWVYEFVVPLQADDPVIRLGEGYNLRVDVLMDNPHCQDADAALMPGLVAMHSSPGLRPRLEWSVRDPMGAGHAAIGLHPETGKPWLSIRPATVFGAEDVRNVTISLARIADDGSRFPVPLNVTFFQGYGPCGHDCGHVNEMRYAPAQELGPGKYNLTVSWENLQGTANRVASAELVIQPSAETPALGPLALLGLLAGLAGTLRRR